MSVIGKDRNSAPSFIAITETCLNTGDAVEVGDKLGHVKKFRLKQRPPDEKLLVYTRDGPQRLYDWYNEREQLNRIIGFSAHKYNTGDYAKIIIRDKPP